MYTRAVSNVSATTLRWTVCLITVACAGTTIGAWIALPAVSVARLAICGALLSITAVVGGLGSLLIHHLLALRAEMLARSARGRLTEHLLNQLPVRISHFDADQRVLFANRYCGVVYGCEASALIGKTIGEVRGESTYREMSPHVASALRGEKVRYEHEAQVAGEWRFFQQDYVPDLDAQGRVQGFSSISFDITERKLAKLALVQGEKRLRDITDNLPALIAYIGQDFRLQFANATFERWTGIPVAQALGTPLSQFMHGETLETRQHHVERALAGEAVSFEAPLWLLDHRRDTHVTYLPDRLADGSVGGVYALVNDITLLKSAERRMTHLAHVDELTGLPNRRQFTASLDEAMQRSRHSGAAMALMFLDVDKFKAINDRFGHAGGDAALNHFADCVRGAIRPGDVFARVAGDEFVVIAEAVGDHHDIAAMADRIVAAVRQPLHIDGVAYRLSVSMGIALYAGDALDSSEFLSRADEALYAGKAAGGDNWRLAGATVPGAVA
ncbi:MAG: hypothetical protein JWQ11_15 [Rhizobacter sp.]|nr:hypothetical protein [Rhizobacter sp.]